MIGINIPGFGALELEHLVLDFNGTIAFDGALQDGVPMRLERLANRVSVHVLTADTFGSVEREMAGIPCSVHVVPTEQQAEAKQRVVRDLGAESVCAIGNGRIDRFMLEDAALGIGVVSAEGMSGELIQCADVVVPHIESALDLLVHSSRLVATLRS